MLCVLLFFFKKKRLKLICLLCIWADFGFTQIPKDWQLSFAVKEYDYQRYNQVVSYNNAELDDKISKTIILSTNKATWKIGKNINESFGNGEVQDITIIAEVEQGNASSSSVGLMFRIGNWSPNNFVFNPGSTYSGNRFESRQIDYSPRLMYPKDVGINVPPIITDIPRLNIKDGTSRMQLISGAAALPCIGYYDDIAKTGYLIITAQGNKLGDYGIEVEENRDRKTAFITITSPHVRELYQYRIANNAYPSDDKSYDFKQGDKITISCRLYTFPAASIAAFYDYYFSLHQKMIRSLKFTHQLPFSAAFKLVEDKYNSMNWNSAGFYGMDAIRTNSNWKPGWVSGFSAAYALWMGESDTTRMRVIQQNNWAFPAAIAPSGFFYERCLDGTKWIGGDLSKFHTHEWHLVRSSGDALYFAIKLLNEQSAFVINKNELAIWETGVKRVANSFVQTWNRYKQFGHFINSQSGEILVGGSTSGSLVPAALVLAAQYFKDSSYLIVAKASAASFYKQFILNGYTNGGPGDALQNPDSESCYGLLESYMALFEISHDPIWLQYAEETAKLFATWVMPYHYQLPAHSTLGKVGIETGGSVWANTQNRHGGPGICTASGIALLKLYEATGNRDYMELLRVVAQSIPQHVSRPDRPIGQLPSGCIDERISTTDWLEGIGEIPGFSTWAEISMMLTAKELPGIYIDLENEIFFVLDHIQVRKVKSDNKKLVIEILNPTAYNASIQVFVKAQTQKESSFIKNLKESCREVIVNAGAKKMVTFYKLL